MTTTLLKQNITKAVKDINDKYFLEMGYTIVSNEARETVNPITGRM